MFNVGNYRRKMFGAYQPHQFYHPDNQDGVEKRTSVKMIQLCYWLYMAMYHRKCAMEALKDVINYLNIEDGQVAVSWICCMGHSYMLCAGIWCYQYYQRTAETCGTTMQGQHDWGKTHYDASSFYLLSGFLYWDGMQWWWTGSWKYQGEPCYAPSECIEDI